MNIWAFDLGIKSIGYAIRSQEDMLRPFDDVQSLIIPEEYGSTATARMRRRAYRTRLAHKAREAWLRKVFKEVGLGDAILEGRAVGKGAKGWDLMRNGDYRLEREFPPQSGSITKDGAPSDEKGARTAYCGALLRALLIAGPDAQRAMQGRELEPWQVFKALHSAIQKRGYDVELPWKRRSSKAESAERSKDDDEGKTAENAAAMQGILDGLPKGRQYPCFWECRQMGLWESGKPERFNLRQTHRAETTAHRIVERPDGEVAEEPAVFPRRAVEAELLELCASAEKLVPALAGKARYIAYGPTETAYASYIAAHAPPDVRKEMLKKAAGSLVPGKATDWRGALAQKIPTFENRVPSSCLLVSRFHAAKARARAVAGRVAEDSILPAEYVFLKKLKDFRFATATGSRGLTPDEIRAIFEERRAALLAGQVEDDESAAKLVVDSFRFTKSQLKKLIERLGGAGLLPEQDEIESPKLSGRSSYSRPLLRVLRSLLLSGLSPREFKRRLLARNGDDFRALTDSIRFGDDPSRGVVADDLSFLDQMGDTWERLFVPDARLDEAAKTAQSGDSAQRDALVRELIGGVLDPVVRHRLDTFHRLLKQLETRHGAPDRIAIEFVRDQFMRGDSDNAKKKRKAFSDFQKRRRDERIKALARLQGEGSRKDIQKVQLWEEQNGDCPFCGNPIGGPGVMPADATRAFDRAQLAHIVPESAGGPRTYLNLVVTCHICNSQQRERYHADWFRQDGLRWDGFVQRLKSYTRMSRFKKKLLAREDALEAAAMVERRTALQQTAWIAKLSQAVVCLHFGWPLNFAGDERRVIVVPGALTNQTARRNGLYRLLGSEEQQAARDEVLAKLKAEAEKLHESFEDRTAAWRTYFLAEEEADKKARSDDRHHALDAMVLSFIPTWATDPTKKYWRGLPKEADGAFFKRELERVVPRAIAMEHPTLEDGMYRDRGGKAVRRYTLKELGYTGQPEKFACKTAIKNAKCIVNPDIRRFVLDFLQQPRSEAEWRSFCRTACVTQNGPLVRRVTVEVSRDLVEFKPMSKDGRGGFRKGDRHQGYFIVLDSSQKPEIVPVFVHQSRESVAGGLPSKYAHVFGYFTSGSRIRISNSFTQGSRIIKAGDYILRTLKCKSRQADFENSAGVLYEAIGVPHLIRAGISLID